MEFFFKYFIVVLVLFFSTTFLVADSNTTKEEVSFLDRLSSQIDASTNKKGNAYALKKFDTDTAETKKLFSTYLDGGFFGLVPYNTNYILPISYSTHKYRRISSNTHYSEHAPEELDKYRFYEKNTEVEFQISFKKPLTYNLFGLNESISVAYTQKVWWQIYSESSPFRETNYSPEIFVIIPTVQKLDDMTGLKAIKSGYLHESNGQEGYRSRSWNRIYIDGKWQWSNLFLSTRLWYKFKEKEKYSGYYSGGANPETGIVEPNYEGDDNPDITDYLGYGDIRINYLYEKHQLGALVRYNFKKGGKNRGAIDLHWSYPFLSSENTFWYAKLFNGYAESLIDYNRCNTKVAFGFSFSRALF
jgi:phospholipase A1